jgi:hypothetical protein
VQKTDVSASIGASTLETVGKMGTTAKLKAKGKKGKQTPGAFEGGEQDVLSSSTGDGPAQQTGLTFAGTMKYEEALEINPAV